MSEEGKTESMKQVLEPYFDTEVDDTSLKLVPKITNLRLEGIEHNKYNTLILHFVKDETKINICITKEPDNTTISFNITTTINLKTRLPELNMWSDGSVLLTWRP